MYATVMAALAMVGATGPVVEQKEAPAAMVTIKRLMESCPRPNPTSSDKTIAARRARLEALVLFIEKFQDAREIRVQFKNKELLSFVQVLRDMVDEGVDLAPLPEEALCWQRAGLDLAKEHYRWVHIQVRNGTYPVASLDQAAVHLKLFQAQYREALARCLLLSK